jgi:hypothetical protein
VRGATAWRKAPAQAAQTLSVVNVSYFEVIKYKNKIGKRALARGFAVRFAVRCAVRKFAIPKITMSCMMYDGTWHIAKLVWR